MVILQQGEDDILSLAVMVSCRSSQGDRTSPPVAGIVNEGV